MFRHFSYTNFVISLFMVLGVVVIKTESGRDIVKPKSVTIDGVQDGYIVSFTVKQVFRHAEAESVELRYIVPNNSKICMYDTTFCIGDEVIKPRIEEKKEAERIYVEAFDDGRAALIASNLGNGLVEFTIGNVPPGTDVSVEVRCAVIASSSAKNSTRVKFPLEVCEPSGKVKYGIAGTVEGDFVFSLSVSGHVSSISGSTDGVYDSGKWTVSGKPDVSAIILTSTFDDDLKSEFYSAENLMVVNVMSHFTEEQKARNNNEFVFLVDCSASMSGVRIERAKQCLDIFIRSLPAESFFNIVAFGSQFKSLFKSCVEYTDENFEAAVQYVREMRADMGGTDIYDPLGSVLEYGMSGNGVRQIFVITDGEVSNTSDVISLCASKSSNNRIFSLGIGSDADAGLVEGMADATGGQASFVRVYDDFGEHVMRQLELSLVSMISDVSIHVEGHDDVETVSLHARSISDGINCPIIVKTQDQLSGTENVIVTGSCAGEHVDLVISKNDNGPPHACLSALLAFRSISDMEGICGGDEMMKQKCIDLSKSSGILSKFTSFVAVSEKMYKIVERTENILLGCGNPSFGRGHEAYTLDCMDMGFLEGPGIPPAMKYDDVTKWQSRSGCWTAVDVAEQLIGSPIPVDDRIASLSLSTEVVAHVTATVMSIALLRTRFRSFRLVWKLIDMKALKWLSCQSSDVDWEAIITWTARNVSSYGNVMRGLM